MKLIDMNWMQVEEYLKHDDRVVLPLGSVEQHGFMSLGVDAILAERVAVEAAAPLGVPVMPVVAYGLTPYFRAYPGSITLRVETYTRLVRDILDGLKESGFKRILICNGHGGNQPAAALAIEWMADNPGVVVKFHNWWNAPRTWAKVQEIDPVASHGSWMENFPWTRLPGVAMPAVQKPMTDLSRLKLLDPQQTRVFLGDGNYGGFYERPDSEVLALWETGVAETREFLEGPWGV